MTYLFNKCMNMNDKENHSTELTNKYKILVKKYRELELKFNNNENDTVFRKKYKKITSKYRDLKDKFDDSKQIIKKQKKMIEILKNKLDNKNKLKGTSTKCKQLNMNAYLPLYQKHENLDVNDNDIEKISIK